MLLMQVAFEQYLCESTFGLPGPILHCVLLADPAVAEAMLNAAVRVELEEEDQEAEPSLLLSLSHLHTRGPASTLENLLASGDPSDPALIKTKTT